MDIVNTQQKDQTVAVYYTRLKGLWDEQNSYSSVPICTSGAAKELTNEKEKENVHQFLMGLNEKYSIVRSQILNTEPLPSLAPMKGSTAIAKGAAFITKNSSRDAGPRNQNMTKDTSKLFCEHCKHSRHTKETCFELHGYLEWWGDRNKKSQGKMANNTRITESTDVSPIAGLSKDQAYHEDVDWHG
ncbi:hypothetical protein P3X46_032263 [Hevea brasiliensis]|uniref:Retrotransposon gag domain-containing protein n=1 Tax=Hevea brasiliensis TaxID=3981 RepID=A0ABQ9KEA1_HEVBR|nr:hypothetical protein P3X46_032263 [Hevea brasiliensis]